MTAAVCNNGGNRSSGDAITRSKCISLPPFYFGWAIVKLVQQQTRPSSPTSFTLQRVCQ
jgi:hypothetical protein